MGRRGLLVGLGVVLLALGCKPARSSLFGRQVTLYVAITPEVEKSDTGNVAAMVDAVESDLREAGYEVTIVAARDDEKPPVPRVELQVMGSDSGNARARGAGKLLGPVPAVGVVAATVGLANLGSMLVDLYWVPGGGAKPRYLRRYEGSSFGAMSEEEVAAGERVGHAIARDLLE